MPHWKILHAAWLILMVDSGLYGCQRMQTPPPAQNPPPPVVDLISEDALQQEAVEEPPVAAPIPVVHEVKWQQETFYAIARWYTGSGANWQRLAEANPTIHPRKIQIGHTILIPDDLLRTRQPMPAQHLRTHPRKKKAPSTQPPKPAPKIEMPPLYGPIHDTKQSTGEEKKPLPVTLESLESID